MLNLEIASPEQSVFQGEIDRAIFPGILGEFEIQYNHTAFMSLLKEGSIIIYPKKGTPVAFYVEAGIAHIDQNNIYVLVDTAYQARKNEHEKLISEQTKCREDLHKRTQADYTALLKQLSQLTSELNAINRMKRNRHKE